MHSDGTSIRIINDSLELEGNLAWSPDGKSITSAANDHGTPHLFRVPVDGGGSPTAIVNEYSIDPVWSPDGSFVLYSGADIGTTFVLKATSLPQGTAHSLPALTLTRGARHITFLPGGSAFVFLRGDMEHEEFVANGSEDRHRAPTHQPSSRALTSRTLICHPMAANLSSSAYRSAHRLCCWIFPTIKMISSSLKPSRLLLINRDKATVSDSLPSDGQTGSYRNELSVSCLPTNRKLAQFLFIPAVPGTNLIDRQ